MSVLNDKISKYLELSSEIFRLENAFSSTKQEIERKYSINYNNLKKELAVYISRIRTTVETVCNLYKSNMSLSNNKISLCGKMPMCEFSPLNAREVAVKAGNESINFLSAIIKKSNINNNLPEFTTRYNTVIEIFSSIDHLKEQAISIEIKNYQNKIDSLKSKLKKICDNEDEFDSLVYRLSEISNEIHSRLFIKDSHKTENKFITEISLPLGYKSVTTYDISTDNDQKIYTSCLDWDLHNDGVLIIKADNETIDSVALSDLTVNIITQFLFSYPMLSKQILLCDSLYSSAITSFAGILQSENNSLLFDNQQKSYIENSDESIRSSLSDLNRIISERIGILAQSGYKNVLEYNSKNSANPMKLTLVLLNGYPFKYEYAADSIIGILKNGKDAGVYVLAVENTHEDENSKFMHSRLPEIGAYGNVLHFKTDGNSAYVCRGNDTFSIDTREKSYNIHKLLGSFKETKESNNILCLDSILENEDFNNSERRKNFSKVLSIPFGKSGSNTININLDASSTDAHLAVIGASGSGKTAFLNTVILSACKLYSPDELEFHMILMRKTDFKVYMEHNLPHLKTLVTGDRISRADDVLDFIDDEMTRRANLIGSYGNIYAYNAKADSPLSRCVIIIDEFYQLIEKSNKAIERINMIAQTGRAYGISLVISAISFPMDVRMIIPQFGNRFEFRANENAGQLIPSAESRQGELGKGRCLFEQNNDLRQITVAFSGDDVSGYVDDICNQYSAHKMTLQNIVNVTRISHEDDVPFLVNNPQDRPRSLEIARNAYNDDGFIRVRLGKTDIQNDPLEYTFTENNNLLFLFGNYLDTKMMEASLIKDVLVLSEDIPSPSVYYIDNNKALKLKKRDHIMKHLMSNWILSGKMVYCTHADIENILDEIEKISESRENIDSDDVETHSILVVISKADDLFDYDKNSDMLERICNLISQGKNTGIYFAIQCNESASFSGPEKYLKDAIIFPAKAREGEIAAQSDAMCTAFESMPAANTEKGRMLTSKIAMHGLDKKLHILCNGNHSAVFVPYEYDEEYLKNIVNTGDLL